METRARIKHPRDLGMRRRSCSIKANTLRRSLQFGFQLQNDIVEQTSCDWVGRFSCQNSVALHPISALLPTVAVSHGDVPPCSDPQRGHNGVLELRSHCGAAIRTPLHFPEAISAANSANGGTATVRMGLPALPRQPPPRCWGRLQMIRRNEGLDPETTPAHRPALIGTTLETSCS